MPIVFIFLQARKVEHFEEQGNAMLAEAFTFLLLPETKQSLKNNSIGESR